MGSKRPLMVGGVLVFGIACFAFIALILFGDRLPGLIFKSRGHPWNSQTNKVEKIESLIVVPSSIGDTTSRNSPEKLPEPEVRKKKKKSSPLPTSTTTTEKTSMKSESKTIDALDITQGPLNIEVTKSPSSPKLKSNSSFVPTDVSQAEESEEYSDEEMNNSADESAEQDVGPPQGKESPIGKLLNLATTLYKSRPSVGDIEGFLKAMNETMKKGRQDDLLAHLNEVYSREGRESLPTHRTDHESSLAAFVFMSFGVFLLNQIHKIIEKENVSSPRELHHESFLHNASGLEVLFSPVEKKGTDEDGNSVNNMFRAMLNLGNAYVKDSQAMECIWALYCEDLDSTGAQDGLYGIASRINSIGLRLIMDQIPTELTLDVMIRSILGWDALPCKKMFPKCEGKMMENLMTPLAFPHDSKPLHS